ncbi:hypothetical protein GGS20DRAFT_223688 [Poronia punctata]|nr:hypothetical protein GGS20DRAFT_223688 [Poronia punctata]
MTDTIADSVTKAPVAPKEDDKAPATAENLPPITKEPATTADASLMPSAIDDSKTADTQAPSKLDDTSIKPEAAGTDATEKPAEGAEGSSASALEPEKPAEPTPTPVGQPTTTEAAASDAPALSNGAAAEQPKPVSVEEIGDEGLAGAKPLETEKPAESTNKTPDPADTTGVKAPAADESAPAKGGDATAGDKRKAEDDKEETKENEEPAEKKQKTNGTSTSGTGRKPGRPKKENKKAPAPVGKTLRKTRSQGAADL